MWHCRLTILGSSPVVAALTGSSAWSRTWQARHIEWLQLSLRRHVCEFETEQHPGIGLRSLSRKWPGPHFFLLDYEEEKLRMKGVAVANRSQVEQCEIGY